MSTIEKAVERLSAPGRAAEALPPRSDAGPLPPPERARRAVRSATGQVHVPPTTVENPEIILTNREGELLLAPEGGRSRIAEEFRLIKRPLLVNVFDRPLEGVEFPNLLMVTSSVQGEGKTFTSLNLAISITMEMDSTVLLVDADVAKPGLSRWLGVRDRPGLIDRLVDEAMVSKS